MSTIFVCCLGVLTGSIFLFDGGIYLFDLFDENVTSISLFVTIMIECYIAAYHIGIDKLQKLSVEVTDHTIPEFFCIAYQYICPVITGLFAISCLMSLLFNEKHYPSIWPVFLEIFIVGLPLSVMGYHYYKNRAIPNDFLNESCKELNHISTEEIS